MSGRNPGLGTGWWTVPNGVTALRVILIIPIVVLVLVGTQPFVAPVLAVVFGVTDWVDGFIARRMGQVTHVGEIFDAVADRFGILCIVLALAIVGAVPWWIILVLVLVDVMVAVVSVTKTVRSHQLMVTWIGKIRTAVIMISVAAVLFGLLPATGWLLPMGQTGLGIGAMLHAAAGVGYLWQLLDSNHQVRADFHEAGLNVEQERK